jgi:hypothetical protein
MTKAWRNIDIRLYAVAASLLLSLWHVLINPLPNSDAFTYVHTAEIFVDQGVSAAFAWYPNATYSVLMGILQQSTGLDLFIAAHILNAFFYALLTYVFITLAQEIKGSNEVGLFAAFTILIFPELNEYRSYVIRDIGYLALLFTALLHLTRCFQHFHFQNAIAFCFFCFIAALFRGEAMAFLILAPLALLINKQKPLRENLKAFGKLQALNASIGIVGLSVLGSLGYNLIESMQSIADIYTPFVEQLSQYFGAENRDITTVVFGEYAANYSGEYVGLFLVAGLIAILIYKLIIAFGAPVLILLANAFFQNQLKLSNKMRPALTCAALAFAIMLGFLLLTRFISSRYALLFCLLVILTIPILLERAWHATSFSAKPMLWRSLLITLALYGFVDAHLNFGDDSASAEAATQWLRSNTNEQSAFFTNDTYLAYHSKRVEDYDKALRYIQDDTIANTSQDTIIAFRVDRRIEAFAHASLENNQIELVTQFPEQGSADYVIYRRL